MSTEQISPQDRLNLTRFLWGRLNPAEPGMELSLKDAQALDAALPQVQTGDFSSISDAGALYLERLATRYEQAQKQYNATVAPNNPHPVPGSLLQGSHMARLIRLVLEMRNASR
jgi:hypothetical protein